MQARECGSVFVAGNKNNDPAPERRLIHALMSNENAAADAGEGSTANATTCDGV